MSRPGFSHGIVAIFLIASLQAGEPTSSPDSARGDEARGAFFEAQVRPILAGKCSRCHGAELQKGGLRLDSPASLLEGGDDGPVVVPGSPEKSLIVQAIRWTGRIKMPPREKLPDEAIGTLIEWVRMGAPMPDPAKAEARPQAETIPSPRSTHWAFLPPASVSPPAFEDGANPIDAFVLAKLRELGISQAAPASKAEWLRRVTYDLTGLPPEPSAVELFLADESPDAFEKVADRLLASPRFGERWAQHWLDLAHYADSNGFELDADRPDAWRYRDWVIQSFNEDMPYDRFLTLQVAGDEVAIGSHEALIAAGFGRSGPREVVSGNIDPEVRRQNELTEITTTVGSVFLGLTLGCARCHDHKFDPLPAADYYSLQAFFEGAHLKEIPIHCDEEKRWFDSESASIEGQIKLLVEAKGKLEEPYVAKLRGLREASLTPREREIRAKAKEARSEEEARLFEGISVTLQVTWEEIAEAVARSPADHQARERLKRQIHDLELRLPQPLAQAETLAEESAAPPETRVLKRGDVKNKQRVVGPSPPGVLLAAMGTPQPFKTPDAPLDATHSGRRLALARWLTAAGNPLTARVIVNRLWQHHFGRGLVATPSDFGTRGERPSNQALLDWLAQELIRGGWRLKPLHRLMVTSQTYRLSSRSADPASSDKDPSNKYLWRMNRRRMEAEGLRDATLAVAGLLNARMGGPGVRTPLEPEVRDLIFTEAEVVDLWPVDPDPREHCRRSIYLHKKRNVHSPMFDAFDAPDTQTSCPLRPVSTHAQQSLVMMNSAFAQNAARSFALSLLNGSSGTGDRITEAFLRAYARRPTADEMDRTLRFVTEAGGTELDRWTDFTLALINSNEFAYVP
jgi:uncharacterized protein DUF1553/uncharacterized protein DUF1549/cytochrome c